MNLSFLLCYYMLWHLNHPQNMKTHNAIHKGTHGNRRGAPRGVEGRACALYSLFHITNISPQIILLTIHSHPQWT